MNNWMQHLELQESSAVEKLRELSDPTEGYERMDKLYRSLEVRERRRPMETRCKPRLEKDYRLKDHASHKNYSFERKAQGEIKAGSQYRVDLRHAYNLDEYHNAQLKQTIPNESKTFYTTSQTPPPFTPYRTGFHPHSHHKKQSSSIGEYPPNLYPPHISFSLQLTRRNLGNYPQKNQQLNPQIKLEMYRRVRRAREEQMVIMGSITREGEWDRKGQKKRKGRIWHGRPPVKIIADL